MRWGAGGEQVGWIATGCGGSRRDEARVCVCWFFFGRASERAGTGGRTPRQRQRSQSWRRG
eukprot:765273-Rhodomonas_salina.2